MASSGESNTSQDGAPAIQSGAPSSISDYRAHDTTISSEPFSPDTEMSDEPITYEGALAQSVSEIGYDNPGLEAFLAGNGLNPAGGGPRITSIPEEPRAEDAEMKGDSAVVPSAPIIIGPAPPPPALPPIGPPSKGNGAIPVVPVSYTHLTLPTTPYV